MRQLAQRIAALSPEQLALLERRVKERDPKVAPPLVSVVADPERCVGEVAILSESETQQLRQWNETEAEYVGEVCLHEMFEAQVERTPELVAVVSGEKSWTYRELNQRANQLAKWLRKLGVGPEVRVGICLERSLEMAAGVLGVLKAGGAYVPLDPAYPRERIGVMVNDAQVRVVLTQSWLAENLPEGIGRVVCLDQAWDDDQSEELASRHPTADNLAYVIYTSGSTGTPKGVAMTHRAVVNLIWWQTNQSNLTDGATTAQFHSFSFDVSCQEMFSTWNSGGKLVLISEEDRRDVNRLLKDLSERNVERLFLPPVALQQLADASDNRTLPKGLRHVIAAGEQLKITEPLANLFRKTEGCTLHNQYGPTESHIVTEFNLPASVDDWPKSPPIGCPIANVQIYLLDERLQPVPIGVPGQLYIGGVALARGYLGRPQLTAERFIPNALSNQPGARIYQTGDMARYLADGRIEFIGRVDNQMKVRGFRVEPEEIESVLRRKAEVQDAVVVVRELVPGDKRLVAYLVTELGSMISTTELHRFLSEILPAYMVPSVFVLLDDLPLTPSGKVNRLALPAPNQQRPTLEQEVVPPRTSVEQSLAGIWMQVLGLKQVGVNDDFFELGGNSLLATQVVSRVRNLLEVELPLRSMFESPTIALLAVEITCLQVKEFDENSLARILTELEQLSAEEARLMLAEEA